MQAFVQLSQHNPKYDALKKDLFEDPNIDSRTIVWSKSHMFDLASLAPIGTNKYYVNVDEKDGTISFSKKYVSSYYTPEKAPNMGAGVISSPPSGQTTEIWEDEGPYKLNPFDLVAFVNKSNLPLITSTVANAETANGLPVRLVPAVLLEYAAHKKLNEDVSKGVEIGFDVMTVVIPFGEVAYLEKAFRYTYKTIDIIGKVAAAANIGVKTEMIKDTAAIKVIKQFHAIAMDLQAANLVLGIKNGLIRKAVAEDYLTSVYAAEDGLEELRKYAPEYVRRIDILKEEMEISAQAGGYGEAWLAGIKSAAAAKAGSALDRLKKLPFLTASQEGNLFRFVDRSGNQVAHTVADGGLVIDRSAATIAENAEAVGSVERAAFRMSDNATDVLDDLIFVQLADGSVQCIRNACFIAGTPVRTSNGMKPIEEIREDEVVLGYDIQTKDTVWQKVTHTFKKQASRLVRLVAGRDTIYSTPEHPYLTKDGWRSAIGLKAGQRLRLAAGSLMTVLSVATIDTSVAVYNFETAITHNYCVGQSEIVVHNDCHLMAGLLPGIDESLRISFLKDFTGQTATLEKFAQGELSTGAWELLHGCDEIRKDVGFLEQTTEVLNKCRSEGSSFGTEMFQKLLAGNRDIAGFRELDAAALKELFEKIKAEAVAKSYGITVTKAEDALKAIGEIESSGTLIIKEVTEDTRRHMYYGEVTITVVDSKKKVVFNKSYPANRAYDLIAYDLQHTSMIADLKKGSGPRITYTGTHVYEVFLEATTNPGNYMRNASGTSPTVKWTLNGKNFYEVTPEVRIPDIEKILAAKKFTKDEVWLAKNKKNGSVISTCFAEGTTFEEIDRMMSDVYRNAKTGTKNGISATLPAPNGHEIDFKGFLNEETANISSVYILDVR